MIWLIRHGESQANAGEATSDYARIALTPRGVDQARCLAGRWQTPPDRIVVSFYLRAQQTALPTRERFPTVPVLEEPVQEFTYLDPVRCAGLTPAQRDPLVRAYWERLDPDHCDGAGAESFGAFVGRVEQFLERSREWSGDTLVFTHEQFIRGVMQAVLLGRMEFTATGMGRFLGLRPLITIPNGGIVRLDHREGTPWLSGIERPPPESAHGL